MTDSARFWNTIAEKYSKQPVADPEAFDRKIAITTSRIRPGDAVLDIGCGTGSLALRLAPSGGQIHGLDISSEMIRIAREKAEAQAVENVTFHIGTLDEDFRAFEPESLDGICAYSILHLVDDLPAILARIYALLKPGGFFVSSTVCLKETWVPLRPVVWVMRKLGKAPRVSFLSRKHLEDAIAAAGFVEIAAPDVGVKPTIAFLVAEKPI